MARVFYFCLSLIVVACHYLGTVAHAEAPALATDAQCPAPSAQPLRFLALGDSYTIGQGVAPSEGWPVQLVGLLREKGLTVNDPAIIAGSGWTTSNLLRGIERENPTGPFDLVSVLIGVNDQVRRFDPDKYRGDFVTTLERAIALADNKPSRVVVLSVPDWSVAPIARTQEPEKIRATLETFNGIARAEAEKRGLAYVDITPSSRQAAQDRGLLSKDQLHPSGRMYTEWARLALPAVCQALASEAKDPDGSH